MGQSASLPIAVRQLTKAYGAAYALDHVDLDVRSGEFLTLLGPSGSGKTTLLMVLAGFVRPDSGSVRFGTQEVVRLAPHKRNVGMVFQNYALFPHMDVAANIAFPLKLRGVSGGEITRRVESALELVQLGGYGGRHIDQLSGGQRQRVALARAIVFEPRIVLMDEPLSALDKQLREAMQLELRRLHERLGTTTIYVTHDQREALTMSDRIAVINRGKVMQLDTPRGIYDRPANRFVAEFIGESAFLDVEVAAGVCRFAGRALDVRDVPPLEGRCQLMLRPERLRILDQNGAGAANVLDGTVANIVFQGDTLLLQVRLADGSAISVRGPSNEAAAATVPAIGGPIRLGLGVGDAIVLPADGG
jgi:putative spermidine/putrescine transport system ATP-binding protein